MSDNVYQYGYDINEISRKVCRPQRIEAPFGYFAKFSEGEKYDLQQVFVKKGREFIIDPKDYSNKEALVYLEDGLISAESNVLSPQETLFASEIKSPLKIAADQDSFVYIFSGPPTAGSGDSALLKSKTFDRRYKDYAENLIETIVNRQFTGKKIFFKKGNSSSLHFHCQKTEMYFIHSGKLFLRLKAGQGQDRFFVLEPGQAVQITPGLMHQAGGLEDTVIIEASTRDYDSDSFIVESEFGEMPGLKERLIQCKIPARIKNILFDMDDVLVLTRAPDKQVKETIFASLNLRWSQIIQHNHLAVKELMPKIFQEFSIKDDPQKYAEFYFKAYNNLLADTVEKNTVPGVLRLINKLIDKKYRLALVTSSTLGQAQTIRRALRLDDSFEVMITANDITHSKPHPEPYQKAIDKLGAKPEECMVIENFPTGVASAKAVSKDVMVVAITTTHSRDDLKEADFVIESFDQIGI